MKDFKELKSEFAELCKEKNACRGEFAKLLQSENEEQLLKVISDNLIWCINNKVITNSWLENFSAEALLKSGVANTGKECTGFANSGDSNSGDSNSGDSNSGDSNSGDSNSGYRNSGSWNSGDSNSGSWNSGSWNSGSWNSGDRNSGDSNSGSWNSGSWNSGSWNSGSWNSGDRNSGDSNSGYRNSGAFCTDDNPILWLFDQPTKITVRDWENHKALQIMNAIDPTIWVPENAMSDKEKKANPKWETTEGYLKTITMKEAWKNMWHNLDDDSKNVFLTLPNFDAKKFEVITGIKVKDGKGAKAK